MLYCTYGSLEREAHISGHHGSQGALNLVETPLAEAIVACLDQNKAEDIILIDLSGKCSFADAMVVASGTSQRHVGALSEHITKMLNERGSYPPAVEGRETCNWVLIDAGDVIVHLFRPEMRALYDLERMWSVTMPAQEAAMV